VWDDGRAEEEEMAEERVTIGLVGLGRIADLEVLGYLEHPRCEILAVCDVDEALARERAESWGVPRVYTDAEQLLRDPDLNAVEIMTPHHLHAEHTITALEAGKHVSLQKPPTRTLEEYDSIAHAAEKSGRVLRVFENFMYYPPHQKAKELIEEGAIGTPMSIHIKTAAGRGDTGWELKPYSGTWRTDREKCGGGPITFDHGYHCYHMGRYFIPAEIERVHSFIHWFELPGGKWHDGPALISWRYEGDLPRYGSWDVIASIAMRVRSKYYVSDDRMEIHGTEGILWVTRCTGKLLEEPSLILYREGETRAFHDLPVDWAESFRLGGLDFVDALLEGRQPPQDADEGRRTLAFAIAAVRSGDEHREITLEEVLNG
jgi:predicted dehydrogenase